jgi:hypothetical protein
MKKYKNFILLEDLSSSEIKEILHRDCQQFLNEGVLLYRGMKMDIPDYQLLKRRHNRISKNMPQHIHKILDELFEKQFGWKARGSGVFVTSSINDAKYYSKMNRDTNPHYSEEPYIFVAKGDFDYLYNPDISDLYVHINNTEFVIIDSWIENRYDLSPDEYIKKHKELEKEYEKELIEFLKDIVYGYNPNEYDIVDAASNYNEIMFNCDEYYLFNIKYKNEISKWF